MSGSFPMPMTTKKFSEELACLRVLLGKLKTGTTSHFGENEKAQLTRETIAENIQRIMLRIAELEVDRNDSS